MPKAPKKDAAWAVQTLRTTLAERDQPVDSAEVIYKKAMPWGSARTRLFLVRYTRGDTASIACVGPFVRALDDLPMSAIDTLPKKTANRRVLALYMGQFFVDTAGASEPPPVTDLEDAFGRLSGSVGINRRWATAGAENLRSTWATAMPAQHCTLTCHAPPEGIELEGLWHGIADATITYDLTCGGTSTEYSGQLEIRCPYYFRVQASGELERAPMPVPDDRMSFPQHRLADILGTLYGPGEIVDKWGWVHFKD